MIFKSLYKNRLFTKYKKGFIVSVHLFLVFLFFFLLLPGPRYLFDDPYSAVLYARDGRFLGARIADDGQWRFPPSDSIPEKYTEALLLFEDRYFHYHPGVNPFAIGRAAWQNFRARSFISGGSTITMQLARMSRKGKPRNFGEKFIEALMALRIELASNKKDILALYASHAPFGGNVVGIEAASWRYFGRPPHDLSWAEAAALAVLPNAPALVHPGRNRERFLEKRNNLLLKLLQNGKLDSLTYQLALSEELPGRPLPLPNLAPHYLEKLRFGKESVANFSSTLDYGLQQQAERLVKQHSQQLAANEVHHLGVLVRDLVTGEVIVYQGNVDCQYELSNACHNDMVMAMRSSGSILKPFLFAAMIQESAMLPTELLADVPLWIGGYSPRNFDESYMGAIPADQALIRSLNIPFVSMLRAYGIEKFLDLLKAYGFTSFTRPASHYGLSLILGGGEVNLWELTEAYRRLALPLIGQAQLATDAGASWLTLNILREVNRPDTETGWEYFGSSVKMAWKTGTSFGLRDAWAVGVTPRYVIGVWAGNADGTGRPGLTGVGSAAPLLFDMAQLLGNSSAWFERPYDETEFFKVCSHSGHLAGRDCVDTQLIEAHKNAVGAATCPYHRLLRVSPDGKEQIPAQCFPDEAHKMEPWFVLPPVMERYYRQHHFSYIPVPPTRQGCEASETGLMAFVYPPPATKIYRPLALDGTANPIIAEVVHRETNATLYWHLNGFYLGHTSEGRHHFSLRPTEGTHLLVVTDHSGNSISRGFEVLMKAR